MNEQWICLDSDEENNEGNKEMCRGVPDKEQEDEGNKEMCSVCSDELISELAALGCGHIFHFNCIEEWRMQQNNLHHDPTCPNCRVIFKKIIKLFKMPRHFKLTRVEDCIEYKSHENTLKETLAECSVWRNEALTLKTLLKKSEDILSNEKQKLFLLNRDLNKKNSDFDDQYNEILRLKQRLIKMQDDKRRNDAKLLVTKSCSTEDDKRIHEQLSRWVKQTPTKSLVKDLIEMLKNSLEAQTAKRIECEEMEKKNKKLWCDNQELKRKIQYDDSIQQKYNGKRKKLNHSSSESSSSSSNIVDGLHRLVELDQEQLSYHNQLENNKRNHSSQFNSASRRPSFAGMASTSSLSSVIPRPQGELIRSGHDGRGGQVYYSMHNDNKFKAIRNIARKSSKEIEVLKKHKQHQKKLKDYFNTIENVL